MGVGELFSYSYYIPYQMLRIFTTELFTYHTKLFIRKFYKIQQGFTYTAAAVSEMYMPTGCLRLQYYRNSKRRLSIYIFV